MKRSKTFFKAILKENKERMLATFEQAKKHTRKIVQRSQETKADVSFVVFFHTAFERLTIFSQKIQRRFFTFIGSISLEHVHPRAVWDTIYIRTKNFFIGYYSKFFVRGEYTKRVFILVFIIAFSLGMIVKSFFTEYITIGFEDYTVTSSDKSHFDIRLQKKNTKEDHSEKDATRQGELCSELDK